MKRFTDTAKWTDNWFRPLSPTAKLLWFYLLDHCDNAGVVEPDVELASFQIGERIEESHFSELGDRIKKLPNGKLWIPKFIRFQFGELSQTSKVHASVIRLIQSHCIDYSIPLQSDRNENLISAPSTKAKEKDKEKDIQTWISELQLSPAYAHIAVQIEFEKAKQWISLHRGRQLTKRFFIGWLNRIERPINGDDVVGIGRNLDAWPPCGGQFTLTNPPTREKFPDQKSFDAHYSAWDLWKTRRLKEKAQS